MYPKEVFSYNDDIDNSNDDNCIIKKKGRLYKNSNFS